MKMNPSSPPPVLTPPSIIAAPPPQSSFPKQAATFSLVAPLASFAISIFLQPQVRGIRIAMGILGLVSVMLILVGLVFGILALVATKRHGRAGIYGQALAGTCINGLLVLFILISFPALTAIKKAAGKNHQQQIEQEK